MELKSPLDLFVWNINSNLQWSTGVEEALFQEWGSVHGPISLSAQDLARLSENIQGQCAKADLVCTIQYTMEPSQGLQEEKNVRPLNLTIQVAPIRIEDVDFESGRFFTARAVRHQLGVKPHRLFHPNQLKQRLQQVMDNPDLPMEVSLEPVALDIPTAEDHERRVRLKIKLPDTLPHHVVGYWSNADQFDYGEFFTGAGVLSNNVLGFGDTFAAISLMDPYISGVVMHYEVPINAYGTRIKLDNSILRTYPKTQVFRPYDFIGKGWTLGLGVSHPLIRLEKWRLTADATFEVMQVRTQARNTDVGKIDIEQENLRDIRYGLQWDHAGEKGSTLLRSEWTHGLDILGATPNGTVLLPISKGGSQFTRFIGTAFHEHTLPFGLTGVFNSIFQWSPDSLPSFQQSGTGGTFTGRGYREAYIGGDTAIVVSAQVKGPSVFIPKGWKLPFIEGPLRDSLEWLVFADYGFSKLNDRNLGIDPTEHIVSVGLGGRLKLNKYVNARLDVGFPLTRYIPFSLNPRIHFGIIGALF